MYSYTAGACRIRAVQVSVELTEAGLAHTEGVVGVVYEYISMLAANGPQVRDIGCVWGCGSASRASCDVTGMAPAPVARVSACRVLTRDTAHARNGLGPSGVSASRVCIACPPRVSSPMPCHTPGMDLG